MATTGTKYATVQAIAGTGVAWTNPARAVQAGEPLEGTNDYANTGNLATLTPTSQTLRLQNFSLLAEEGGAIPNHADLRIIGVTIDARLQIANSTGAVDVAQGRVDWSVQSPAGTNLATGVQALAATPARQTSAWTTSSLVWSGDSDNPQSTMPAGGVTITRAMLANGQLTVALIGQLAGGAVGSSVARVAWAAVTVVYAIVPTRVGALIGVGRASGVRRADAFRTRMMAGATLKSYDNEVLTDTPGLYAKTDEPALRMRPNADINGFSSVNDGNNWVPHAPAGTATGDAEGWSRIDDPVLYPNDPGDTDVVAHNGAQSVVAQLDLTTVNVSGLTVTGLMAFGNKRDHGGTAGSTEFRLRLANGTELAAVSDSANHTGRRWTAVPSEATRTQAELDGLRYAITGSNTFNWQYVTALYVDVHTASVDSSGNGRTLTRTQVPQGYAGPTAGAALAWLFPQNPAGGLLPRVDTNYPITAGQRYTLEGFFYRMSDSGFNTLFAGNNASLGNAAFALGFEPAANGNNLQLWYSGGNVGATWTPAEHGMVLNTWYHVVFTWDMTTNVAELFVDGVSKGSRTVAGDTATTNLKIGASTADSASPWHGFIAKVAAYPAILSNSRIQAHYDARNRAADQSVPAGAGSVISGAGLLQATRRADLARPGRVQGAGVLSGDRDAEARRLGALAGMARLSAVRRADAGRRGALAGLGILSAVRTADVRRTAALVGAGVLSGARRADSTRAGLVFGTGVLSGVRRLETVRAGRVSGTGALSAVRRADQRRTAAITGTGSLTGSRLLDARRAGALAGVARLSGSRTLTTTRAGLVLGTGILSGARGSDQRRSATLYGMGFLSGGRSGDLRRTGALVGTPNKLKGWGVVVAYGISAHVYDESGVSAISGARVDLFRSSDRALLQTATSDATGYFAFTLTSDPIAYFLRGHKDDGAGDNDHLVDTTDEEILATVTQVQGPSAPSPG